MQSRRFAPFCGVQAIGKRLDCVRFIAALGIGIHAEAVFGSHWTALQQCAKKPLSLKMALDSIGAFACFLARKNLVQPPAGGSSRSGRRARGGGLGLASPKLGIDRGRKED